MGRSNHSNVKQALYHCRIRFLHPRLNCSACATMMNFKLCLLPTCKKEFVRMVRTRSRARQEASQRSPLKSLVVEEASPLKPAASHAIDTRYGERTKPESPPGVEELALRALHVMKKRLGTESGDCSQSDLGNAGSTSQPNIMMLESDPKPSSSKTSGFSTLASSLQPCMKEKPYFSLRQEDILASASKPCPPWEDTDQQLMARSVITPDFEKRETVPPVHTSKYARARARKVSRHTWTYHRYCNLSLTS